MLDQSDHPEGNSDFREEFDQIEEQKAQEVVEPSDDEGNLTSDDVDEFANLPV